MNDQPTGLSDAELAAETAQALPDKEVVSILDLNADLDLAIDAAAPIDLGVAANANIAAPIDAAVGANILSEGSTAQALADQGAIINQDVTADATATSTQDSDLVQGAAPEADAPQAETTPAGTTGEPAGTLAGGATLEGAADATGSATGAVDGAVDGTTDAVGDATSGDLGGTVDGATDGATGAVDGATGAVDGVTGATGDLGSLADGNLLDVNVDLNGDANLAAPVNGAVAANANVAAPIDAAVAANVGSVDSDAVALAQQDVIINQGIEGEANATADQTSDIDQP